jgi:SNF2 family DNA or RNA helicase
MLPIAPGARVLIRDEEWLVRRVDHSNDGGRLLVCDGISELVRGRLGYFLTELEDEIQVLDPAATELVADDSPYFNAALLYLEAQLGDSAPNDELIHLGHSAVMNHVRYQLDPALQALRQPRQRILIADSTGLGKTLEAGILVTELIQRGRGQRILVITLKSMLTQFQKEFWCRFTIPLVRLDSLGLQRVRNQIPSNHNPFNYFDRTIISIDTLKANLEYRNFLESAWWDIIVIDECHNVAARGTDDSLSRRARLARLLAGRSDTLILLSATPHDGSARSFASLMALLDPTAISDPDDYTPEDYRNKGLVIDASRRTSATRCSRIFPSASLSRCDTRPRRRRKPPTAPCSKFRSRRKASTCRAGRRNCSVSACRRRCSRARWPRSTRPNVGSTSS